MKIPLCILIRYAQETIKDRYRNTVFGPAGSDNHTLIAVKKKHVLRFGQTVAICSR